jgi:hypothetical protein
MPVNGLLLTISLDRTLADEAQEQISKRPGVFVGVVNERWLPVVAETPDVRAAHEFHEWLESLPGIEQVDVIYVGFEEPSPITTAP